MKKLKPNKQAKIEQRAFEREQARAGEAVLSFSTAIGEPLPAVKQDDLPPGKFVFIDEYISAIRTRAKVLEGLYPSARTATVLDRRLAAQTVLSAVVLNAPINTLPGMPSAAIEVEHHERKLVAAAHELRELNQKMIARRMSYEEFNVEVHKLDLPEEMNILLRATQRGGNLDLVSKQGTIALRDCRREIKHLPSGQTHQFSARVIGVTDSASGYSTVTLLNPKMTNPIDSVISKYTLLTAPLVDRVVRKKMLLAQMDNLLVEIQAHINAVPLVQAEGSKLEVEILNCEGLTASAK